MQFSVQVKVRIISLENDATDLSQGSLNKYTSTYLRVTRTDINKHLI